MFAMLATLAAETERELTHILRTALALPAFLTLCYTIDELTSGICPERTQQLSQASITSPIFSSAEGMGDA